MTKLSLLISRMALDSAQISQLCTLVVYLATDKTDDEDYFSDLETLINTLTTRSMDKLTVVRRWAKRVMCDERFNLGKLLKYMRADSDLRELATAVQSAVDGKDNVAIDKLTL
jgi:hypothetical protein